MQETLKFFKWLFEKCESGYINFRFGNGPMKNYFIPLVASAEDLDIDLSALISSKKESNCYFGVALREKGNGKKDGITQIPALWIDLDGAPLDPVVQSKWMPSCVVETSPGRYHDV